MARYVDDFGCGLDIPKTVAGGCFPLDEALKGGR